MFRRHSNVTFSGFTGRSADIHGSVEIGMALVSARATPKLVLGLAVAFLAMSAFSASTAGITRIDGDQKHASQSSLVFQKQPQLRERPRMQNCSLLSPGLDPFADTLEVLNGNAAPGAFGFSNDLLGNIVVDPRSETVLLPRERFQPALCRSGPYLLKLRPQPAMTITNALDSRTAMQPAIGVAGDVRHAHVNAEKVGRLDRGGIGQVNRAVQVELALAIDQISLPFDAVKALLLVLAVDHRDDYAAAGKGPQADLIDALEAEDALVVGDRAERLEYWTLGFVAREALGGFADGTDRHLSREAEALADLVVAAFLDTGSTENASLKPRSRRECSRPSEPAHGFKQPLALVGVGENLQLERQLHYLGSILLRTTISQPTKGRWHRSWREV